MRFAADFREKHIFISGPGNRCIPKITLFLMGCLPEPGTGRTDAETVTGKSCAGRMGTGQSKAGISVWPGKKRWPKETGMISFLSQTD